jgi:hypothetical protein
MFGLYESWNMPALNAGSVYAIRAETEDVVVRTSVC